MLQIRHGLFETNSSSSHAIIIRKEAPPLTSEIIANAKCHMRNSNTLQIEDNEYGRSPFRLLTNWVDRFAYAVASYCYDDDKVQEIIDLVCAKVPCIEKVEFPKENEWYGGGYGYVDHQSADLLGYTLKEKGITLEDFIFNDKYVVVIDGDEYCILDDQLAHGRINKDEIEEIIQ